MCAAYAAAVEADPWSSYVLMNDDLGFEPDDLISFLATYENEQQMRPAILVGSVISLGGNLLYGGFRRENRCLPLRAKTLTPDPNNLIEVDTFNGNLAMVPGEVMTRL